MTVTIDGTMTGERNGVGIPGVHKVRESGGEAVKLHCIIHQEALCWVM